MGLYLYLYIALADLCFRMDQINQKDKPQKKNMWEGEKEYGIDNQRGT